MIEKMLKATVICRIEDRDFTLDSLRSLGILHVEHTRIKESPTQAALHLEAENAKHISVILNSEYKAVKNSKYKKYKGEDLVKEAGRLFDEKVEAKKDLETYSRYKELLSPWGDFSQSKINKLKDNGIFVYLCNASDKDNIDLCRELGSVEVVSETKSSTYFAVISSAEIAKDKLPLAVLPPDNISLDEVIKKISDLEKLSVDIESSLAEIAAYISVIKDEVTRLEEELEFLSNKNGMGHDYVLCYITGFIPKSNEKLLTEASRKNGWAVKVDEPGNDDKVPTLITLPKMFRLISPVFDFIGISPGYREWDVSICFLFFFTIFFAMIVGDAGYGFLFLCVGIFLKVYFRNNEKYKLPINLMLLLSIATIIWGALTCTYFGLSQELFPKQLQGMKMLTEPGIKDKNIQYLCFILAAMHLSFARIWKAFIMRNSFRALGQLGWAMFIWANFFTAVKLIVFPEVPYPVFAFYLYGIGAAFILLFNVDWKDVGSVFNLPFAFIGSFSDVLSYIRLFAVGLASYYIASSFNDMGSMVLSLSPYLIVFTIIVLLFGHLLNIALALMGVLVHGIRLNTLEFSNQMELEWAGFTYNPFKKKTDEPEEIIYEKQLNN